MNKCTISVNLSFTDEQLLDFRNFLELRKFLSPNIGDVLGQINDALTANFTSDVMKETHPPLPGDKVRFKAEDWFDGGGTISVGETGTVESVRYAKGSGLWIKIKMDKEHPHLENNTFSYYPESSIEDNVLGAFWQHCEVIQSSMPI